MFRRHARTTLVLGLGTLGKTSIREKGDKAPPGKTGSRAIRKTIFSSQKAQSKNIHHATAGAQKPIIPSQLGGGTTDSASSGDANESPTVPDSTTNHDTQTTAKTEEDDDSVFRVSSTDEPIKVIVPIPAQSPTSGALKTTNDASQNDSTAHSSEGTTAADKSSTKASGVAPKKLPDLKLKVKKKPVWGERQLRDSWSKDAMNKLRWENISQRIHREYRYHPDEYAHWYTKWGAVSLLWLPPLVAVLAWKAMFGVWLISGDYQHILNLMRDFDTSPRSKFSVSHQQRDLDDIRLPFADRQRQPQNGSGVMSSDEFSISKQVKKVRKDSEKSWFA